MAILEEDIARLRQATDIVEVVSEHVGLKKVGRRWSGLCPFHGEKSPSFSINAEEGLYYCFGCQAKGDVISFIRAIDNLSFVEAVERLAARAGIEIRHDSENANKERRKRAVLTQAMERAVEWYHQRLLSASDAAPARAYLRDRGYDGDVVRQFKIGWAPAGWDELAKASKLTDEALRDTGLGFVNSRGRRQDAFRGRILFPIFDASGSPVAFGGRILPGADGPKYKNSSETPLYSKSRTLYALNWAKTDIVNSGEVVVCEGYTDVIGFFLAGIPRAVATCGTALTEEHVRVLKSFAPRIVLAYDADGAGQAAAERFYEWERKLGVDIAVAEFPRGTDPADAAWRDPQILRDAVAQAKPYLAFRLERVFSRGDLRTVEGRARVAEQAIGMVSEHPNELVRDQYLMEVADRCRVPVDRLREVLSGKPLLGVGSEITPGSRRIVDIRPAKRPEEDVTRAEWEALRVAIHQPEDVAKLLDTILATDAPTGIDEVLFVDERARDAFRALLATSTLADAMASAQPEAGDLLARLAVEEEEGIARDEFIRLIDRAAMRVIRELEIEARRSSEDAIRTGPSIAWLKLAIERLRSSEEAISLEAATSLVSWLLERLELTELDEAQ